MVDDCRQRYLLCGYRQDGVLRILRKKDAGRQLGKYGKRVRALGPSKRRKLPHAREFSFSTLGFSLLQYSMPHGRTADVATRLSNDSIAHWKSLLSMPFLFLPTPLSHGPGSRSNHSQILQESRPQPVNPASIPPTVLGGSFELCEGLVDRSVPVWSLPTGEFDKENVMPRTDATRSAIDARQI